jgi:hypothetical protein
MTGWLRHDNVEPFLTVLSWLAQYDPAPDEFSVIRRGVELTDAEKNCWYDFEFVGANHIRFSLASDPGSSVVHVKVDCPELLKPSVETAVEIFARFRVGSAI